MKVYRNGKSYELTPDELVEAYFEQERNFDIADCQDAIRTIVEDDTEDESIVAAAKKILNSSELISDCAVEMRVNINKYDMYWSDARDSAIRSIIQRTRGICDG